MKKTITLLITLFCFILCAPTLYSAPDTTAATAPAKSVMQAAFNAPAQPVAPIAPITPAAPQPQAPVVAPPALAPAQPTPAPKPPVQAAPTTQPSAPTAPTTQAVPAVPQAAAQKTQIQTAPTVQPAIGQTVSPAPTIPAPKQQIQTPQATQPSAPATQPAITQAPAQAVAPNPQVQAAQLPVAQPTAVPKNSSMRPSRPAPQAAKRATAQPPVPPKKDTIVVVKQHPHITSVMPTAISMADQAANLQQQNFIDQQLGAVTPLSVDTAPQLDARTFEIDPRTVAQKDAYLGEFLQPWIGMDPNEKIDINFDNKELAEFYKFLERNLRITFILDDSVGPKRADGLRPVAGTKITFKSHTPFTPHEVWNLALTFSEMSGFSIIPSTLPRTYRVTTSSSSDKPSANNDPMPTFIGSDPDLLPDSDVKIRYVYFVENAELSTIKSIIDTLKSSSAGPLIEFPDLRGIVLTDKSSSIKSMIKLIQEVDTVDTPETLAIIRLQHSDATEVQNLYASLIGQKDQQQPWGRQKKTPTTHYFTESTRVFAYPYTNSLMVFGTRENIKRFEDFVFNYVDKRNDLPYSPLHIYQLKYIDSESIAKILGDLISQFNQDPSRSEAAKVGGVRAGNQFFKPTVKITPETSGNRLIINADYEEYLKLRDILERLDVEQPQVALKVMILDVDITNADQFGTQLRNAKDCCNGNGALKSILGSNINFQTSNLGPIVTRDSSAATDSSGNPTTVPVSGAERLLGNLINLVAPGAVSNSTGASVGSSLSPFGLGTTLVTLGKDVFGFWGLLAILESITRVSVVANPFIVATNKYQAEISVGETRRVLSGIVTGGITSESAFDNLSANLDVKITPQISYDDMITLNIYVDVSTFVTGGELPTTLRKQISTEALVANKEVVALGGLIKESTTETVTKVPILGDIPLVGWLFKNKTKTVEKNSLLILICPEIIKPHEPEVADKFTYHHIHDAKETLYSMTNPSNARDPIHRWIFGDHLDKEISEIDKFTSRQSRYVSEAERKKVKQLLAQGEQEKDYGPTRKNMLDLISKTHLEQGVNG